MKRKIETDDLGEWEVVEFPNSKVRYLTKPSLKFKNIQKALMQEFKK